MKRSHCLFLLKIFIRCLVTFGILLTVTCLFFAAHENGSSLSVVRNVKGKDSSFFLDAGEQRKNERKDNKDGNEEGKRNKVLILSSMPRSGSTLLGQLLTTATRETVYYFEPDQYIEQTGCLVSDECTTQFFKGLYECKENKPFETWFKRKSFFFQFYNPNAKNCVENKQSYRNCVQSINLVQDCETMSLILTKNIRTRLKVIGELLEDQDINLKIIHLTRDPRGSLRSIGKFKWNIPESKRCQGQLEDLTVYQTLKQKHPDRITSVTYESLCLNPWTEAERLFQFLFNDGTLPQETKQYILDHYFPKGEVQGVMSTIKESKTHADAWRAKIAEKQLASIENEPSCRDIIVHMGYRLFGSKANALNASISVFAP